MRLTIIAAIVFIAIVVIIVLFQPRPFVTVSPTDRTKSIRWTATVIFALVMSLAVIVIRGMTMKPGVLSATPVLNEQRLLPQ